MLSNGNTKNKYLRFVYLSIVNEKIYILTCFAIVGRYCSTKPKDVTSYFLFHYILFIPALNNVISLQNTVQRGDMFCL